MQDLCVVDNREYGPKVLSNSPMNSSPPSSLQIKAIETMDEQRTETPTSQQPTTKEYDACVPSVVTCTFCDVTVKNKHMLLKHIQKTHVRDVDDDDDDDDDASEINLSKENSSRLNVNKRRRNADDDAVKRLKVDVDDRNENNYDADNEDVNEDVNDDVNDDINDDSNDDINDDANGDDNDDANGDNNESINENVNKHANDNEKTCPVCPGTTIVDIEQHYEDTHPDIEVKCWCGCEYPTVKDMLNHQKCHCGRGASVQIKREDHNDENRTIHTPPTTERRVYKLKDILTKGKETSDAKDTVTRDLADIQSILSVTSTTQTFLQHLNTLNTMKQMIATPPAEYIPALNLLTPPDSNSRADINAHDDEQQDQFAAEFRKMKLKGEFPCRLCTAIFPNLRALKGHNRAHLSGNNTGPYQCNMCPHTSIDKAALIRHMRTHNGDRPYECSLCNYAFTTKANCERHLRNRHGKVTREDVKRSIIYHPSEDVGNEDVTFKRDEKDVRKALNFATVDKVDASRVEPAPQFPKIHVKSLDELKESRKKPKPLVESSHDYDSMPMLLPGDHFLANLTREPTPDALECPVLDLSKKRTRSPVDWSDHGSDADDQPQDLSSKKRRDDEYDEREERRLDESRDDDDRHPVMSEAFPQNLYLWNQLRQQLPFNIPIINPFAFMPAHPYLTPNASPQMTDVKERLQKEFARGLQLSGGSLVLNHVTPNDELKNYLKLDGDEDGVKPLTVAVDDYPKHQTPMNVTVSSPSHKMPELSALRSNQAVKMVIKNGVLMPKQKQRRYRTERPFSCEHCSARFTLRSNMERHIKQQHPQYWSQRQRANILAGSVGPGRKPAAFNVEKRGRTEEFSDGNVTDASSEHSHRVGVTVPELIHAPADYSKPFRLISDEVKMAILAQQFKQMSNQVVERCVDGGSNARAEDVKVEFNENDDEDALVIDEESSRGSEAVHCRRNDEIDDRKDAVDVMPATPRVHATVHASDAAQDLVPIAQLIDNASARMPFNRYFQRDGDETEVATDDDECGVFASTSEENISGSDGNRSENEIITKSHATPYDSYRYTSKSQGEEDNHADDKPKKKKSAYSMAPNRVTCPFCSRKFPWSSSLQRHILTHTGQKPFKCPHCPLLFTTKSNCDRHLLRKHGNVGAQTHATPLPSQESIDGSSKAPELKDSRDVKDDEYLTRNVPERPFKCSVCPSSTFSTLNNLQKHLSSKHTDAGTYYESHSSEDEYNNNAKTDKWDAHGAVHVTPTIQTVGHVMTTAGSQTANYSELPFKCHLCDNCFAERADALAHIKLAHPSEFDVLITKGALESAAHAQDDAHEHSGDDDNLRGKFPDYANRKVMCAFCLRRFWSAEDLRRHMRTHTGERPFSCDICRRRFTLKHSMLRHRKKHGAEPEVGDGADMHGAFGGSVTFAMHDDTAERVDLRGFGDCDGVKGLRKDYRSTDGVAGADGPLNLAQKCTGVDVARDTVRMEAYVKMETVEKDADGAEESPVENAGDSDLIGNLLGINDKTIIDKVLRSSADDAAKLLGV